MEREPANRQIRAGALGKGWGPGGPARVFGGVQSGSQQVKSKCKTSWHPHFVPQAVTSRSSFDFPTGKMAGARGNKLLQLPCRARSIFGHWRSSEPRSLNAGGIPHLHSRKYEVEICVSGT